MFVRTVSKRSAISGLYTVGLLLAGVLLLYRPQAVTTGISRGLSVCTGVIIPTLYPFMLLAGLLTDSPLCRQPGRVMNAVTSLLFGLPGSCGAAILLSLVGGYPAGALAIGRLRQQKLIEDGQARRMLTFCVCGGPGFIVGTVGAGLLGSVRAGLLLFSAQVAVSLTIGLWQGRHHRLQTAHNPVAASQARPLATVVSDTCGALLTMCGFVVLAAVVLALTEAFGLPAGLEKFTGVAARYWSAALAAITEVSCGCIALTESGPMTPFFLSLTMSWAGLSVQGQLAAALPGIRVLGSYFWGWRLLHGVASGLLSSLLFALIPTEMATLQSGTTAVPHAVSLSSSIMLLILSFLAMLCFSPKKTGKMN